MGHIPGSCRHFQRSLPTKRIRGADLSQCQCALVWQALQVSARRVLNNLRHPLPPLAFGWWDVLITTWNMQCPSLLRQGSPSQSLFMYHLLVQAETGMRLILGERPAILFLMFANMRCSAYYALALMVPTASGRMNEVSYEAMDHLPCVGLGDTNRRSSDHARRRSVHRLRSRGARAWLHREACYYVCWCRGDCAGCLRDSVDTNTKCWRLTLLLARPSLGIRLPI
jgi:hypothetical protein